jgi:hypothetical protein
MIAVGGGAVAGALAGFIASVVLLAVRRIDDGRRARRGEAPRKHLVLPRFHLPGAVLGAVAGGVTATSQVLAVALIAAFVSPLFVLGLVVLVGLLLRARSGDRVG